MHLFFSPFFLTKLNCLLCLFRIQHFKWCNISFQKLHYQMHNVQMNTHQISLCVSSSLFLWKYSMHHKKISNYVLHSLNNHTHHHLISAPGRILGLCPRNCIFFQISYELKECFGFWQIYQMDSLLTWRKHLLKDKR